MGQKYLCGLLAGRAAVTNFGPRATLIQLESLIVNHQGTNKSVHNRYFILSKLDSIQILSKNKIGNRKLVHNKRMFILSGFIKSDSDCNYICEGNAPIWVMGQAWHTLSKSGTARY